VRTIPDGVVLTSLKQEGDILTLEGRTQSNARVSAYMRNLESSGWMSKPELSVIEAKKPEPGKDGPTTLSDISALPYMFEVKVTLPAQSEPVNGINADGSVVVPADAAAVPADPAAAPVAPLSPGPAPTSAPPAAAPATAPAAEPAKPSGSRIAPPAAPAQPAASSTPQKGGA
jgi:type IV pilus assembly protein PilN